MTEPKTGGEGPKPFKVELSKGGEYQPILNGVPESRGMRSGRVALGPGEECGLHNTDRHEEILVILEGAGTAHMTDRGEFAVRAGEVLYVPPDTEHNVIGGEDGLKYVYVVAPIGGA